MPRARRSEATASCIAAELPRHYQVASAPIIAQSPGRADPLAECYPPHRAQRHHVHHFSGGTPSRPRHPRPDQESKWFLPADSVSSPSASTNCIMSLVARHHKDLMRLLGRLTASVPITIVAPQTPALQNRNTQRSSARPTSTNRGQPKSSGIRRPISLYPS